MPKTNASTVTYLIRKWFEPRSNIPWLKKIIWVIGVLRRTVVTYWTENGVLRMPWLTLWPSGDDKSTIKYHVPGWLFLGITPKWLADMQPRNWWGSKGASNPTTWDFDQVIISNPRKLKGWKHFGGGRLQGYWRRIKTNVEIFLGTSKNISSCWLIWVVM